MPDDTLLPAHTPLLRPACTCKAGVTCAVCRAYAQGTPPSTRGQVLGGLRAKLKRLRLRLPLEERHLALLRASAPPLYTPAQYSRLKKRQYEQCTRLRGSIAALEARLAAWHKEEG